MLTPEQQLNHRRYKVEEQKVSTSEQRRIWTLVGYSMGAAIPGLPMFAFVSGSGLLAIVGSLVFTVILLTIGITAGFLHKSNEGLRGEFLSHTLIPLFGGLVCMMVGILLTLAPLRNIGMPQYVANAINILSLFVGGGITYGIAKVHSDFNAK